ncbi:MAG: amidohydrolase family protein [Hyphomicrobiales bacterium]
MSVTILRNATLLDATSRDLRPGCDVAVEGELIREVSDRPIKLKGRTIIDLKGKTLMPGLIDAHVHAIAVTVRLADLARMPPSLLAAGAGAILEGMLDRGFTTVRDAGGAEWGLAEAVRRGLFKGPRMFVSGLGLAQTGGQGDFRAREEAVLGCPCCHSLRTISRVVDGSSEVRKAVREELRKGANQIKIFAAGGIAGGVPVNNVHFAPEELRAAVEEAEAARTYVMAHVYSGESIRRVVEAGVRTIEHGNLCDADTARLMKEKGAYVVPTLTVYKGYHKHGKEFGLPSHVITGCQELLEAARTSLEVYKAAGVKMGHGSDLEGELHPYQSEEFRLKAEVLSPHEVIACATETNAEILGMAGKLGVIAAGALADLLVVDGNPLKNLRLLEGQGRHLLAIMKDGLFHKNQLAAR